MDALRSLVHRGLRDPPSILHVLHSALHSHSFLIWLVLPTLVARFLYTKLFPRRSSIRYMPGPPNTDWLRGNKHRTMVAQTLKWKKEYGSTYRVYSLFGTTQVFTSDPVALNHILQRDDTYQKPSGARFYMQQMMGNGLLAVEDEQHAKLRRILSPAFSLRQTRLHHPIFLDKALELVSVWSNVQADADGWAAIDVLSGIKAASLDIIGLAGFNYSFNSLAPDAKPTELDHAMQALHRATPSKWKLPLIFLRAKFPVLQHIIPPPSFAVAAKQEMERIGMQLLQDARADSEREKWGTAQERTDLLSCLVKSNLSENPSRRLSDADVISQIPTFFVAGHETSSVAASWALYALALRPEIQSTLRAELLSIGTDTPTADAINGLAYLDKVVREVTRLYPAIPHTGRIALRDDVIPLERGREYVDTRGKRCESISLVAGDIVYIPIAVVNRDKGIWGPDADDFIPDRWDALPDSAYAIQSVYSNMLSFLNGAHNCIGYRFAIAEIKCFLYTLIRNFEFELAGPAEDVVPVVNIVQRPALASQPDKGFQLPMRVRRANA
ncbi:Cytochrome P450 [Mycena kentingensis (nom. inval.)]|nr:Cytochrome P450 [Mycena kentingensis (nom. inval.)]